MREKMSANHESLSLRCSRCGMDGNVPNPSVKAPTIRFFRLHFQQDVAWDGWIPNIICKNCGASLDSAVISYAKQSPLYEQHISQCSVRNFCIFIAVVAALSLTVIALLNVLIP
jgi:transcription elongation factor Elf1